MVLKGRLIGVGITSAWPANTEMERIITEYGNTMLRLDFLYLSDAHLAEDALQDTLIKAAANLSKFKGISSEKICITRIMINHFMLIE